MDAKKAKIKIANICSKRETPESDVVNKLSKWNIDIKDIKEIVKWLIDNNFINENRYAAAYTREKLYINKWGKNKIREGLIGKKINRDIIDTTLSEIDVEDYKSICHQLLEKKSKSIPPDDEYKTKVKIIRFLVSRGFEYDIINSIL